ncbi:MAG: enoyl-CoA hydratase/isomerase family protein [Lentisphaeria bacterium]|nr:enoyl-CoA hydratase/isomerase family protein [Candidatus Neomarinimicrobiota bacterium]MCF7843118.1 enoyl-CoA hydratase/isomerase family protein [Lentisphaeria bacterium]
MKLPGFENVNLTLRDHTLTVELNRPPVNALNQAMVAELHELAHWLAVQNDIWLITLAHTGKTFCAGADLKERAAIPDEEIATVVKDIQQMCTAWAALPQPIIVALRGTALGGGLELALTGDILVADETAKLGFPEVALGIIPGAGGTQRLSRRTSIAVAKKWIFTAKKFTAEEALRDGVLQFVYPVTEFEQAFAQLITQLQRNAPLALRQAKIAIRDGAQMTLPDALDFESDAYAPLIATEDRKEALQAFLSKRPPKWRGE